VSLHGSEESSSSRGMMTSFASIQPNFHHNYDRVDQHPIQFIGMRGFSVEEMECSSSVDERQEEEEIPLSIVQHQESITKTAMPVSRRRRRPRAEVLECSMKLVEKEQERYESFLQRIEALEQSTNEMIADDHLALESCEETQKLIAEIENQQKSYYITLEEAKKDHEMITNRMDELSKIENSLEGIIEENGWSTSEDDTLEAGHASRGIPSVQSESKLWPGGLHEITTSDFCDEISEVSLSSIRYMYLPAPDATMEFIEKPFEKDYDQTDATVESTVITSGSASSAFSPFKNFGTQITQIGTVVESEAEDSSSPLAGASFFYSHNFLGGEDGCHSDCDDGGIKDEDDFKVSDLLEDAKFIRRNEGHLVLAPTPFVRIADHSEEGRITEDEDDKEIFCFTGSRKRTKPGQWAIFRRSQQDLFVTLTTDETHRSWNKDDSRRCNEEILCFGGRKQSDKSSCQSDLDPRLSAASSAICSGKSQDGKDMFWIGAKAQGKKSDGCSILNHATIEASNAIDDSQEVDLSCIGGSLPQNNAYTGSVLYPKNDHLNPFVASVDIYKDDSTDEDIFWIGGPKQRNKTDECTLPCLIQ